MPISLHNLYSFIDLYLLFSNLENKIDFVDFLDYYYFVLVYFYLYFECFYSNLFDFFIYF